MIKYYWNLRKRPFFTSECLLVGFLFFFLVLSGPRFAKIATLCGGGALLLFMVEVMARPRMLGVIKTWKPLIPYFLFIGLAILLTPLVPDSLGRIWTLATGVSFLVMSYSITRYYGRVPLLEIGFPVVVCGLCFLMIVAPSLVGAHESMEGGNNRVNYKAEALGEGGGLLASQFSIIVGISVFFSLQVLLKGQFYTRKLFKLENVCHLGSMVLGFYLIVVLSGSRQGLFWLFLGAMYCYAVYTRKKLVAGALFATPVTLFLVFCTFFFFSDTEVIKRIQDLINPVAGNYISEDSALGRLSLIQKGLSMWWQSPIWGNGNEAFRKLSGYGAYSHNNYVEILANYGLIGFFLYYIPLFMGLKLSVSKFLSCRFDQFKKEYLWVAFCIVAILVSNMFMPTYYMKHMLLFMGVIFGRLYYLIDREQTVSRKLTKRVH